MKLSFALLLAASLSPPAAAAICVLPDPEAGHPEANAFVATITSAWIVGGEASLQHGQRFTIHYRYRIEAPIRGIARPDLVLYSTALYSDPNSDKQVHATEGVSYVPGDPILVAYDAQTEVSMEFCARSGHWRGALTDLKAEWAQ